MLRPGPARPGPARPCHVLRTCPVKKRVILYSGEAYHFSRPERAHTLRFLMQRYEKFLDFSSIILCKTKKGAWL
ncbi:hypothetical protein BK187_15840 [Brucella melitensis]|nr:hypothetical protein BK206_15825 [Brucella melitensis]ATA02181.1 hypothetical protein CK808_12245 [Brucella abortus]ARY26537.1 hypothetical protein BK187_15840 [Brucella melitensis]ARY32887.1 hypothetical protein BK184_15825 [Brucella melitensis]ARZ53318.1 hypothetical protein BK164_15845 [Brucella melitensis]